MKIMCGHWQVEYRKDGFFILDQAGEAVYQTRPVPGKACPLQQNENEFSFDFSDSENTFRATVRREDADSFSLTLEGAGAMNPCAFPGPWMTRPGDQLLFPHGDGIMVPAETPPPLPEKLNFYCGSHLSMGLLGLLRGEGGLLAGIEETADAEMTWRRSEQGLTEAQTRFIPAKGEWRYARRLRFFLAREDGFNRLCRAYRAWRQEMGMVVPLAWKAEHAPRVRQMAGRADVWIFDDQNMNRLYGRPVGTEETPRDVRRIADEMLALGMDRVLFNSFEGESRSDADYLKARGFEVGRYDIYRDVIPKPNVPFMLPYRVKRSRHTEGCWPQDVRVNAQGKYAAAWQLHGTDGKMYDQHAVCDIPALRMTMEDVPRFIEETGYTSWFIDVGTGSTLCECFAPLHPADRRDAMRYLNAQNQFLLDMGLINGVEVGCEAGAGTYVFSEGMMSPPFFRAPDSGRRMNTLYYGQEIPENIPNQMLNPLLRVPLWQMIYHDCTINYWYWGDSSNCCPELMRRRDQFNALYGVPPLYSLNMTQWERMKEEIAASYRRATAAARETAFSAMTRYERLSPDGLLQRACFENGVQVTANFSDQAQEGVAPGGCRVEEGQGRLIAEF